MTGRDLVPFDPERYARHKARVDEGFWRKLRRTLGNVPFVEDAVAAWYCALDADTPIQVKATLMAALAYFVVPTDMLPDFVAWLGYTDDAAVLAAALRAVAPHIQPRHRELARAKLRELGSEDA